MSRVLKLMPREVSWVRLRVPHVIMHPQLDPPVAMNEELGVEVFDARGINPVPSDLRVRVADYRHHPYGLQLILEEADRQMPLFEEATR